MPVTLTQASLLLALAGALGYVWYRGRGRWRSSLENRFVYGIPWGTAVTVGIVVTFYLLVQGGGRNWSDPLTLPFISWSYAYPSGVITAGIAHGSPEHLVSNMTATLALAPIAEYAWSHYPSAGRRSSVSEPGDRTAVADRTPPRERVVVEDGGWSTHPWIRAVVVFPAALLVVAFVTSAFSLGPTLGFSGAVFAIAGFAVVQYPLSTVFGVVAASALGTFYDAFAHPTVRESIDVGTPGPPSWAGIGFQAHMLGFLLGVLFGITLLWYRRRQPSAERVFAGTVLFGLVQSLWLVAWTSGDDEYVLYQGVGVAFVCVLTILVTAAVTGSSRPLPRPLSRLPLVPTRFQLAIGWLLVLTGLYVLAAAAAFASDDPQLVLVVFAVLWVLLALPALPAVIARRFSSSPISRRQTAIVCLVALTLLVAAPSLLTSLTVVGDDAVPGSGGVAAGDYTVTYEEDVPNGRTFAGGLEGDDASAADQNETDGEDGNGETTYSGVVVVSDDREVWTVDTRERVLAHDGTATVDVGGIGWRERVTATRTGWTVLGNETAYAVDLTLEGGEPTRSFTSEPVRSNARLDDHAIDVVPTDEAFDLRVSSGGSSVGSVPIPTEGESATVGPLRFSTESVGDDVRVFASTDDTRVQIAERETY